MTPTLIVAMLFASLLPLENVFAESPAFPEVRNYQTSVSVRTAEIPLTAENCSLQNLDFDSTQEADTWGSLCTVNVQAAVAPLMQQGYEFGDLRYRYIGGDFKLNGIETHASGWQFELAAMPTVISAPLTDKASAIQAIQEALAGGNLKLRMSFHKITCVENGADVSDRRERCPLR